MRQMVRRAVAIGVLLNVVVAVMLLILKRNIRSAGDEASDWIELATIMEGRELKSRSTSFQGGTALTLAGGCVIDLREAHLDPAGAQLNLRTVMGGTSVIVPEGWRVSVRGHSVLGGIDGPRRAAPSPQEATMETGGGPGEADAPDDRPLLSIDATAVMAGVDVAVRPSGSRA